MKILTFYFTLIIAISLPAISIAQTTEIDSLKNLLQNNNSQDSIKVDLLNNIADALKNINPTEALLYSTQAGEIANTINYKKGQAESLLQIAACYYVVSEFDKVLEYSNQSLIINKAIDNKKGMAENYSTLGKIYYFKGNITEAMAYVNKALLINQALNDSAAICYNYAILATDHNDIGDYKLALNYAHTALDIAYKINDDKAISYALNNLGVVYDIQGNYPKSLDCYQKSLLIDESQKNYKDAAIGASNIALILTMQGNYTDALAYCQKGLDYSEKVGFKTGLTYNYENMGHIYKEQGNYSKAWECQQKTLTLQKEIGNQQGIVIAYRDLAELYLLQDKPNEAMDYYEKALELSKTLSYKRIEISSYIGIATIYNLQNKYNSAYQYSKKAYTMAKDIGNIDLSKQSAEVLAKSCEGLGLYYEAYKAYVEFKTLSDSLHTDENIKKIANLEYKYKYEKEKEILKLEQQKKDKLQLAELKKQKIVRNTFIGGFTFMIILAIITMRSFMQNIKANKLLHSKNNEIEHQAEELKTTNDSLLKLSQFKEDMTNMVIHDLKNPLSVILNIDKISNEEKRMDIIKHSGYKMMNLVQNILDVYKYESAEINLLKEDIELNEIINKVIEEIDFLGKLRKLAFNIDIEKAIVIHADALVLMRTFNNILSNAVKFSAPNNTVTIKCLLINNSTLKVAIHNYGSFIPAEKQKYIFERFAQIEKKAQGKLHSTGLGLTYCKLAIEAHGGNIGVESAENKGTTFWFTLPNASEYSGDYFAKKNKLENNIKLTLRERKELEPIYPTLLELSVHDLDSFKDVFEIIENKNLGNYEWITALENSIYNCHEDEYKSLVNMIIYRG